MLELKSVSRVFPDGTRAIDNISIDIKRGEFCVLLGPSGAGKSTLMGMVNGLVTPSQGDVILDGEKITLRNIKNLQKRVSMIHQQLNLVPRSSVLHNVISGKLHAIPAWRSMFNLFTESDQRRACKLLHEVNLEEQHIHRRVSALSGGQQQRVAIARAFISSPEIVLADEPVASLDPTISRSVLSSLKHTSRKLNAAVLCSLHQVEFAIEYADRIIALRQGRVVYNGSAKKMTESILRDLYLQETPSLNNYSATDCDDTFIPQTVVA